jgi:hypothetical protein
MMSKTLNNFFEHFGTVQNEKTYPKETPLESIVIDIAERWDNNTQPGHGMFFDFSATPELQKPVLDYLVKGFGWSLEKPYFIRKPKR